ncbi:hypothetical protein [Streptomyces sp. DH12]|uniref:hypothetical protein n=1 Tax=Streptomyces sp. DH12 TaxID=2857010 RepID=UPI001E47DED2|nr:hypothetical protein [Streptomyces sp. DH12]
MTEITLRVYRVSLADGAITPVGEPRTHKTVDILKQPFRPTCHWPACGCPRCMPEAGER